MTGKSIRILTVTLAFLGVLFVLQPVATAEEVTMQLTGSPTYDNNGGVYTSPYSFEVSGISPSGAIPLNLACDDFATEIYFGDTWNAYEYTLANVSNGGPQKFQAGAVYDPTTGTDFTSSATSTTFSAPELYYAEALLAYQLFTLPNNAQYGQASAELSYAIWQIFDPTAYTQYVPSTGYTLANLSGEISAALGTAVSENGNPATLGFTLDIYTPCGTGGTCTTNAAGKAVSQEFLGISVPEGSSTLAILALDLLTLFGGVFFLRRRSLRKNGV